MTELTSLQQIDTFAGLSHEKRFSGLRRQEWSGTSRDCLVGKSGFGQHDAIASDYGQSSQRH
jgi:hypothetical protein